MIRALVFDFDGLLVDTEWPEYLSWQTIFQTFGCEFPLALWQASIGTAATFDPYALLAQLSGRAVNRDEVRETRRAHFAALMAEQTVMPGVWAYVAEARQHNLRIGVASNSTRSWVTGFMAQFGLAGLFDSVKCADDVGVGKPDPAVYLAVLRELAVAPDEAVAFEDSPNGLAAAKAAGIFCVAVPNQMTNYHTFDQADLRLGSLTEMDLAQVLARARPRSANPQ